MLEDSIGGEYLRNIEAGRTAPPLRIVRIFWDAPLHAKVAVSAFIQRLAPGKGDRVPEACAELPHQGSLQCIVRCARRTMVPGFLRDSIRIWLPRVCPPGGERDAGHARSPSVVVAADVHTVRCRAYIVQREDGAVTELLFDARVVLFGARCLPVWIHHIVHIGGPEGGRCRQVAAALGDGFGADD